MLGTCNFAVLEWLVLGVVKLSQKSTELKCCMVIEMR